MFTTRIDNDVLKAFTHLSVDTESPISTLLKEAILHILKKYEEDAKK